MPKFIVTDSSTGRSYEITGPAGTTGQQAIAEVQRQLMPPPRSTAARRLPQAPPRTLRQNVVAGAGRFLEGVLPGSGAATAGLRGVINNAASAAIGNEEFHPAQAYNENSRRMQRLQDQWANDNPTASGALRVGGMAASLALPSVKVARGAGIGAHMANGALTGAAYGAGAGALQGEGTDRIRNAVTGAVAGGTLGAAAAPAVTIASHVAGRLARRAAPLISPRLGQRAVQTQADRRIGTALAHGGYTPAEAAAEVARRTGLGVPAVPADISEPARHLTAGAVRIVGPGQSAVREAIANRQSNMAPRVQQHISSALGDTVDPHLQAEALTQSGREAAAPLYDAAYAAPPISSPAIDRVLATPAGREGLSRARTIAANEGRNPTAMGFALDAEGNVVLNQANARAHSDYATAKSAFDEATAALASQRSKAQGGAARGNSVALAAKAVEDARIALAASQTTLGDVPTAGVAAVVPGHTTQTLDYVKRGMDDHLEDFRNPVTGKLDLNDSGRAINGVRTRLLAAVDEVNPAYGEARAAYAGPAADRQAFQTGRQELPNTVRDTVPDARAQMRGLDPSQTEQFRLGDRTRLSDAVGKVATAADATAPLGGNATRSALIRQVHGDEAADQLEALIGAERDAHRTAVAIGRSSPPAALSDAPKAPGGMLSVGANLAMGR